MYETSYQVSPLIQNALTYDFQNVIQIAKKRCARMMWDLAIWGAAVAAAAAATAATSKGSVPTSQTRLEVCSSTSRAEVASSSHATAAPRAQFVGFAPLPRRLRILRSDCGGSLPPAPFPSLLQSFLLRRRRANQCWWDRKTEMKISEHGSERGGRTDADGRSDKGKEKEK